MDASLQIPLFLQPVYKEYIWGGDRFIREFHRKLPPGRYAEAWEISDHPDGPTPILAGPNAGLRLAEAIAKHREDILGPRGGDVFPLLIKLIDAAQTLSVQVHPDEAAARQFGGEAKSEMWVVLSAKPDAHIYSGFQPGVTEADLRAALQESGRVEHLLQSYPARAGMVFSTPGGRVHAIGSGCLLLEIQQDANTTYRLYDWDRLDKNGRPRTLHIEQALRVIDWAATASPIAPVSPEYTQPGGPTTRALLQTPHFHVEEWTVSQPCEVANPSDGFLVFFATQNDIRIRPEEQPAMLLLAHTTCLIPAAMRRFRLAPAESGKPAKLIVARMP